MHAACVLRQAVAFNATRRSCPLCGNCEGAAELSVASWNICVASPWLTPARTLLPQLPLSPSSPPL